MKASNQFILFVLFQMSSLLGLAQDTSSLLGQIKNMAKLKDPEQSLAMMKQIIADNGLEAKKDAEAFDVLNGTVAIAYLRNRQYDQFQEYIGKMHNPFNRTSFMDMGANILISEKIDTPMAERLARKTVDLYLSFRDDPDARPSDMQEADWNRFMKFAQYPFYDTYAMTLYANGHLKQALEYQEKAFPGPPEEGIPPSVERYAKLLEANGQDDKAYDLLMTMARQGKSTAGMDRQLKAYYSKKHGSEEGFDAYFGQLQSNVQSTLESELRSKMMSSPAPGFQLLDLKGKPVSLADYRGKVVVLDFWATWCTPCIASFPAMETMVKKHPEVVFLFIATQEKPDGALERVTAFVEKKKYAFHVLMDKPDKNHPENFEVVSAYQATGIPTKAVIDRKGILRFKNAGFTSDTELINELEAMIELAKQQ